MSRKKLYFRGLGTGYIALLTNIVFSFISIPFVLGHLGKEEFGLWSVVVQIVGYLALLDIGIGSGLARILIDAKGQKATGEYGTVLLTGCAVQSIIGLVITVAGWGFAVVGPGLLAIPGELHTTFMLLIGLQATVTGVSQCFRMFGAALYAHQQQEIEGINTTLYFPINLAMLWLGFELGMGIYAMVLAAAVNSVFTLFFRIFACLKYGILPGKGEWGRPSMAAFKEIFTFSRDIFLMSLGGQVLSGAPILIISRVLGLDAAATWSVCIKPLQIFRQVVSKPLEFSVPALSDMFVRREQRRLHDRIRDIYQVTAAIALAGFTALAAVNPVFVTLWTGGRIHWEPWNHAAIAAMLACYTITAVICGFPGITKRIGMMRYSYFIEAVLFVGMAWTTVKYFGVVAIPLAAIVCRLLVSFPMGIHYFKQATGAGAGEVLRWSMRACAAGTLMAAPALMVYFLAANHPTWFSLILGSVPLALAALAALVWVALPKRIVREIQAMIHARLRTH